MWMGCIRLLNQLSPECPKETAMSQGVSHYPISLFLNDLVGRYGPSRPEFIQALGYRNLERGLNRLNPWLESGDGFERVLRQIRIKFPEVAAGLDESLQATKAVKDAERQKAFYETCQSQRATFKPFIHVLGEVTVPNGICVFGLTGGHERWTTIKVVPSVLALPLDELLAYLPELMRGYLVEYGGNCPFFGKVTGFLYVRCMDYFQFNREGQFIEHVEKPFRRGVVTVRIK
jgi:hypothetical protein